MGGYFRQLENEKTREYRRIALNIVGCHHSYVEPKFQSQHRSSGLKATEVLGVGHFSRLSVEFLVDSLRFIRLNATITLALLPLESAILWDQLLL